jgi:uncharacterized membrane protein YfcA
MQQFLPASDLNLLVYLLFVFIISGVIKGFLGIGMPTAAMGFLTLVFDPIEAIALLIIPIVTTNFLQFKNSKYRYETMINYWVLAISLVISALLTSLFITKISTSFLTLSIGITMLIMSLNELFGFSVRISGAARIQVIVGALSGFLGGMSSIFSPLVTMFLIARGVDKERFISATGFLFLLGGLFLLFGLVINKVLEYYLILKSIYGLIFILFGFKIGEFLRKKVNLIFFQRAILIMFGVMGVRLIFNSAYL